MTTAALDPRILVEEYARAALRDPLQFAKRRRDRICPICGFTGKFLAAGPRPEARCPNCASKERDRIMGLHLDREGIRMEGRTLLHFSPERPFWRRWHRLPGYVSGDVKVNRYANTQVDITRIQFPDEHFDYVICHHVLEHVPDDARGMRECARVLKPGGRAFFSVPQDLDRAETWERPPEMSVAVFERIVGRDHKRLYGRDFGGKLAAAGFRAETIAVSPEEAERHRLGYRGLDQIYVCAR